LKLAHISRHVSLMAQARPVLSLRSRNSLYSRALIKGHSS
jgi:hypothetical protein